MVAHSPTLAINEEIARLRAAGVDVLNLGFGEAGLPVLDELLDVYRDSAHLNGYAPVAGSPGARAAAAGYFTRRGLPTDPDDIVIAPGSKALLYALLSVLPGDVVLPRPSWVSYAAQAALRGKHVEWVDIPPDTGGVPDPEALRERLAAARRAGRDPGVLVLTLPDNPTGSVAGPDAVAAVCQVAAAEGLAVISDEIYRDLVHDAGTTLTSAAEFYPERTYITNGLSKSLALGGWRTGFLRTPANAEGRQVRTEIIGLASEVWSGIAAPLEPVLEHALAEPPAVRERIDHSRRLHGAVARSIHAAFVAAGATCRPPEAGFYLYPDFATQRARLAERGIDDGPSLSRYLLREHGIGVLPGSAFGDDPDALRLRVTTSLTYGHDHTQQLSALAGPDPLTTPHVAACLARLSHALGELTADVPTPAPATG